MSTAEQRVIYRREEERDPSHLTDADRRGAGALDARGLAERAATQDRSARGDERQTRLAADRRRAASASAAIIDSRSVSRRKVAASLARSAALPGKGSSGADSCARR